MTRLLTAAVLIPLTWYTCKRAPFPLFVTVALIAIGAAAWECYGVLRARGSRPLAFLGVAFSLAVVWGFAGLAPRVAPITAITLAAIVVPLVAMARRETPEAMLDAASSTLYPIVFVALMLAHAVALRAVPGEMGSDLLLLLVACVAVSDTAAYYIGSTLGKHKLAPSVSPKKTWEGAAGGLLGSIGGALVANLWFFQRLTIGHALAVGVLVAAAGIAGDLVESMLKRAAGVKDSSRLLPGHGGLLDR
jgi:phosphatidate cytidylyltransferase